MQNTEMAFEMTCNYLKLAVEYGAWLASNGPETERIREIRPLVLGTLKADIYLIVGREYEHEEQIL